MTFDIIDTELEQIKAWQKIQIEKCPGIQTAIGGRWEYSFNPTSIGTSITVKDLATGDTFSSEINW